MGLRGPRLINLVGDPGSGKDFAIQAVADLGSQHGVIVSKHTSRNRRSDDKGEMICCNDPGYDLHGCDVRYLNYGTEYGLMSSEIWDGITKGRFIVSVVSNVDAINHLKSIFGDLFVLVYVHSQSTAEDFSNGQSKDSYAIERIKNFRMAFDLYLKNYLAFDHVLIWSGDKENLYDQIFRIFRAYELCLK